MNNINIDRYLNQECVWEKKSTDNSYGEATRTSQTIKCRKERREKLVRTSTGKEVISTTTVYTRDPVKVDDKIDNRVVLDVMDYISLYGDTIAYEVLL